ncbi:MFS transporter [Tengunoibacter tsumagoiensis]|uniref:MFS transporter n=1 Tax=Tengunoibacter tsumagoiensis TaxID=2014871 RepID=A0A401ZXF5_9CHLR|nr:MFS transporter [Tengunoibacter tsumagoiensis]GCE11515.1 MFS transporter [Tengunoibacter tsumagoiensis]
MDYHSSSSTTLPSSHDELSSATALVARLERLPFFAFHRRLLIWLGLGLFFVAFNTLVVSFTITATGSAFQFDPNKNAPAAGTLIALGFLAQGAGAVAAGVLAEYYGRKRLAVAALLLSGIGIIAAFSWSLPSLIIFHTLQDLGIGAFLPLALTWFVEYVPAQSRGKTAILLATFYIWGDFLLPVLSTRATALFGADGWRALFVFGGAAPVLCALAIWFLLPESVRWLVNKGDEGQAQQLITKLEAEAEKRKITLADPATTRYSADTHPTRLGELFSSTYRRSTIVSWTQWFVCYFIATAFSNGLPTLFVAIGYQKISLLLIIAYGTASLLMTYGLAFIWKRSGARRFFLSGNYLSFISAVIGAILVGIFHLHNGLLFIADTFTALGAFVSVAGLYLYTAELFPTRIRAWALSTSRGMQCLATLIAPFLTAYLIATFGLISIFVLFGTLTCVGLLVFWRYGRETRQEILEELAS